MTHPTQAENVTGETMFYWTTFTPRGTEPDGSVIPDGRVFRAMTEDAAVADHVVNEGWSLPGEGRLGVWYSGDTPPDDRPWVRRRVYSGVGYKTEREAIESRDRAVALVKQEEAA